MQPVPVQRSRIRRWFGWGVDEGEWEERREARWVVKASVSGLCVCRVMSQVSQYAEARSDGRRGQTLVSKPPSYTISPTPQMVAFRVCTATASLWLARYTYGRDVAAMMFVSGPSM